MTTHIERQRLAAMANSLRPDWPLKSLYTLLTDDEVLVKRAYRDIAVALAWVGTDPDTRTPARLAEPGPWWGTAATTLTSRPHAPNDKATHCGECGIVHTALSPCSPPNKRTHGKPEWFDELRARPLDIDEEPEEKP
jgi:hypothetical protein